MYLLKSLRQQGQIFDESVLPHSSHPLSPSVLIFSQRETVIFIFLSESLTHPTLTTYHFSRQRKQVLLFQLNAVFQSYYCYFVHLIIFLCVFSCFYCDTSVYTYGITL